MQLSGLHGICLNHQWDMVFQCFFFFLSVPPSPSVQHASNEVCDLCSLFSVQIQNINFFYDFLIGLPLYHLADVNVSIRLYAETIVRRVKFCIASQCHRYSSVCPCQDCTVSGLQPLCFWLIFIFRESWIQSLFSS